MTDGPLTKPAHLADGPLPPAEWLAAHAAAVATAVLGALTFLVVAVAAPQLWAIPDWRLSVPGFALTAVAGVVSVGRRERAWGLVALGIGLGASALVLGWLFGAAIVIAIAIVVIVIMHAVL